MKKGLTLAEGATHVVTSDNNRKIAFTLAEVLITLGIIGIVASITLPTLIREYNKHAWVNALKQNYSMLNQGFKKMMADDGVEFIGDTETWQAMYSSPGSYYCRQSDSISNSVCKNFYTQLGKYFKIIRIGKGTDTGKIGSVTSNSLYLYKFTDNSGDKKQLPYAENIIYLSNGAMIWGYQFWGGVPSSSFCDAIYAVGGHLCSNNGFFNIDINGNRGPNELGRDIFSFVITERGQLVPLGGNDYAIFRAGFPYTQERIDGYKARIRSNGGCMVEAYHGSGNVPNGDFACTGLLIEQLNWKMDY